jgi:acyl-CoA thioester hydrolase
VAEQVGLGPIGATVDAFDGVDVVGAGRAGAGAGDSVGAGGAAEGVGRAGAAPRAHGRKFVFECPMRWGDMDSFGHINNVVYLRYLEQARVEWMFNTAREAGVPDFSLGTVVARHEIDYKRPLVYRAEPVRIETWVTEIKNGSFTIAYEVRDPDCVYATASTVLVPYDLGENRPRRITSQERGFIEQYLIPPRAETKKPTARSVR